MPSLGYEFTLWSRQEPSGRDNLELFDKSQYTFANRGVLPGRAHLRDKVR